jgi:hypothetical protein
MEILAILFYLAIALVLGTVASALITYAARRLTR